MKIYAFEVRDDEREYFHTAGARTKTEIVLDPGVLTSDKIPWLEPGCAVSVLGMHQYGQMELDLLKKQGVHCLSTRTIGHNHIDVNYARQIGLHVCNAQYDPNGVADYTIMMILLCLPCILGFNLWSGFQPFGPGSTIQDLEDFIVSNTILPIGTCVYVLFCTHKSGWGYENFLREANAGEGLKLPRGIGFYLKWILPVIILVIFLQGYWDKFL